MDVEARRQAWYDERVHAGWPRVRVECVQVVPCAAGHRARAVIQLAGLLPMEVRVELVPAARGAVPSPEVEDPRMWSTHSNANGSFVYERSIPIGGPDIPRDWLIRVRPANDPRVPPLLHRFRSVPG